MLAQRWMWIAWPAFLVAAALEMVVFALVDPSELHWRGQSLGWSSQTVYTLAFFFFWAVTCASSALTTLLAMSPFEVNRCSVSHEVRAAVCAQQGCGTDTARGRETEGG